MIKGDTMANKKYVAIIDTETNLKQMVFDIGVLIGDLYGNIVFQKQYIITDNFFQQLFFEEKRGLYTSRINGELNESGEMYPSVMCSLEQAFNDIESELDIYNVRDIYAYNSNFDVNVLQKYADELNLDNPLQYYNIQCLWLWSSQIICNTKKYWKFCEQNELKSEKGFFKTSAESVFGFITNNPEFVEEHTALEDCKIEYQIFLHLHKKTKKKIQRGSSGHSWLFAQPSDKVENLPTNFQNMYKNFWGIS